MGIRVYYIIDTLLVHRSKYVSNHNTLVHGNKVVTYHIKTMTQQGNKTVSHKCYFYVVNKLQIEVLF